MKEKLNKEAFTVEVQNDPDIPGDIYTVVERKSKMTMGFRYRKSADEQAIELNKMGPGRKRDSFVSMAFRNHAFEDKKRRDLKWPG